MKCRRPSPFGDWKSWVVSYLWSSRPPEIGEKHRIEKYNSCKNVSRQKSYTLKKATQGLHKTQKVPLSGPYNCVVLKSQGREPLGLQTHSCTSFMSHHLTSFPPVFSQMKRDSINKYAVISTGTETVALTWHCHPCNYGGASLRWRVPLWGTWICLFTLCDG